jgi:hypothetical protein
MARLQVSLQVSKESFNRAMPHQAQQNLKQFKE